MEYILSLDQGTTSSRAIVFDKSGNTVGMAQQEYPQIYPKQGWVEHDPKDIIGSIVGVYAEALIRANVLPTQICAIGITNQRETTLVWDKVTGKPVYNAIVWQCRRTAEYCNELISQGYSDLIYKKTGLVLDAYFSATKIKWILDNIEGARERAERGELLFGTVDTFIMWHLSRGEIFATDYTNASRTMLFNIHTLCWDEELLNLFNIPRTMLPRVYPSGYNFGKAAATVCGAQIPICGVVGDQQAALFGQLCVKKGEVKNTYGTGCFLLMNTGDKAVQSKNGLVTTLGASVNGAPPYVLEGSVFIGGAVVQWLRDELKIISSAKQTEDIANSVESSGGVFVVPAFTGLGAPYWDADARGTICGITRGSKMEHIVRASLESIAYQVNDLIVAMEKDAGVKVTRLAVDGGASANNFLMSFQADISNLTVVRPSAIEVTALGAAYLAGLTVGYWQSVEEIKKEAKTSQSFNPTMQEETRQTLLKGWDLALRRARLI
ncbi:MAG: glycerol kinase GlpK [Clostridiales bacterium]|nr:glycerol kinase GlpK [Clostridiales bacterium]